MMKQLLACAIVCLMAAETVGAEGTVPSGPDMNNIPAPIVTAEPEIAELSVGAKGESVLRLQKRLAEMGFFFTAEDGIYGANTKNAVIEFENYLRMLEQDEIDRQIDADKTPEPTITPEASAEPTALPGVQATNDAVPSDDQKETPTSGPIQTPAPTPVPTPVPTPQIPADGKADVFIQEILFGDVNTLYRRDAQMGDRGEDVLRIQRRLTYLNYLNDEPDYRFGVNTETALKAFQTAHDLNASGVADRSTQEILFSDTAQRAEKPVYNQLYWGRTGEDVKKLQKQLRLLGFTNSKVSGTFDDKTQAAVMLLETYLHELEIKESGVIVATVTCTPVPEEILDQQGQIEGDPDSNPYEISAESGDVAEESGLAEEGNSADETNTDVTEEETQPDATDGAAASENEDDAAENEMESSTDASVGADSTGLPEQTDAPPSATAEPAASAAPAPEFSGVVPVNPNGNRTESQNTFVPKGVVTAEMQIRLFEEGVPVFLQTVQRGSSGEQVKRVQRRLYSLGYLTANSVDGIYGKGTQSAVAAFQRRNKLSETGAADRDMQTVLFSEEAVKAIKPYQIRISTKEQRVYVYTHDDKDEYNIEVKKFICSTGLNDTPTPKGTFTNTGPGARWHYFKKFKCWAQYAYYINGDIMFHSVLYDEQDVSTLRQGSVNALGSKASHGCVRLKVEDAKWIYENCKAGTTVIVY